MTVRFEQLTEPVTEHGEGPVWSDRWSSIRVLDMLVGDIVEITGTGSVRRRNVGDVVALLRPRRGGGWMCVTDSGIVKAQADELDAPVCTEPPLWTNPAVRPNDGACAPDGSLYMGSMAWTGEPGHGELVRMDREGRRAPVLAGLGISNGLGWTTDGQRAFFVDSTAGTIDTFDWNHHDGLTNRRVWAEVCADGVADGLAVDRTGGVWVAIYGGSAVHHYDARGNLAESVWLPTSQPTSVAFAGHRSDRLIVTTSRHGLAGAEAQAGAIFELHHHGALGAPVHPYAN